MEKGFAIDNPTAAQIDLLIKILATQKATASVVLMALSKSDDDSKEFNDALNDEYVHQVELIRSVLFEQFGYINLNDILGDEKK